MTKHFSPSYREQTYIPQAYIKVRSPEKYDKTAREIPNSSLINNLLIGERVNPPGPGLEGSALIPSGNYAQIYVQENRLAAKKWL